MNDKSATVMGSTCMVLGLAFVTTGVIGYPIAVRSQMAMSHQMRPSSLPVFVDIKEVSDKIPALNIKDARDPFHGDAISSPSSGGPSQGSPVQSSSQGSASAFPTLPNVGPTIGNRVPDIAPNAPSYNGGVPGLQMSLEAVALGIHPFALVKIDGHDRSVTIGDSIAGSVVSSISISHVGLANGQTIAYSQIGNIPLPGPNQQGQSDLVPGQLPPAGTQTPTPFPPFKSSSLLQPPGVGPITTPGAIPTSQPTATPERLQAPNCQRNVGVSTTPAMSPDYPTNVAPAQPCAQAPSLVQ